MTEEFVKIIIIPMTNCILHISGDIRLTVEKDMERGKRMDISFTDMV